MQGPNINVQELHPFLYVHVQLTLPSSNEFFHLCRAVVQLKEIFTRLKVQPIESRVIFCLVKIA